MLLTDVRHGYWLSAAPIAYDGKVIVGEAGADWGANAHIFAIDAATGAVVWKFNVIPTGNEVGANTWKRGSEHGGGASWSTYTLNVKEGHLYVSVGNPAPSFNGAMRPGDNLFTDSVVVLNFRTGKLEWYAQQTPHDVHDWDTGDAPVVYEQNGREYMAVGNKAGWLYIYDRATHKLLARQQVTTQENMDAPITTAGTHVCPGSQGGVEWNGPAYAPNDGLLFINSVDWCGTSTLSEDRYVEGLMFYNGSYKLDPKNEAKGWTRAFNAATGKPAWTRPVADPHAGGADADGRRGGVHRRSERLFPCAGFGHGRHAVPFQHGRRDRGCRGHVSGRRQAIRCHHVGEPFALHLERHRCDDRGGFFLEPVGSKGDGRWSDSRAR